MIKWLKSAAAEHPDKPFIIEEGKSITYKEADELSGWFASFIAAKYGIKQGDKAAIISNNTGDFILLTLALWKLGAVPVPLNVRLLKNEVNELISFINASVVFTADNIQQALKSSAGESIYNNTPAVDEEDTAVIIFTSGSTGKPKGVELSFRNLYWSYQNSSGILNHTNEERWLASLPFYHVGGFSIITRALISSSVVIIPSKLDKEGLSRAIINYHPTLVSLVSTQLKRLMEQGCKPGAGLKHVLLGGGFIEASLAASANKEGWNIAKVYGSTETSSLVTAVDIKQEPEKINSAGKPLTGNKIFILDENKNPLPPGSAGEIAVESLSCAKGYLNNPEESCRKFNGNIYYTGDIGRLDENGYLYIEARRTDLIVSGGENINPKEVEDAILKFPGIKDTAVIGIKNEEWGHVPAAFIERDSGFISQYELKAFLREKLSPFKIPKLFIFLRQLPRNEMGKINRQKLNGLIKNAL